MRTRRLFARGESGKILIMALVLLVVGVLLLTPLLGLMSTGLRAGQVYERKAAELYAADAGVEDALWRIQKGDLSQTDYPIAVNGKSVRVQIHTTDARTFIAEMLGMPAQNWVHSDWVILASSTTPGTIDLSIDWNGSGNVFLTDVGVWLGGRTDYAYVADQLIDEDDIRYSYPPDEIEPERIVFGSGTAFVWVWDKQSKFLFKKDTPPQTLTFQVDPAIAPQNMIAFTMAGRKDVGLSALEDFTAYLITATATSDGGEETTIAARATHGCDRTDLTIWTWNVVEGSHD